MDNTIKQYIQHLIIDTVTAVSHLDTTIYLAFFTQENAASQNSNILHKRLLIIIKQICRKLIKIIIITKADKGRTVGVIDKDVYQ